MEKRSLKTLLSQGAAGGACGNFLSSCVMVVSHPDENNVAYTIIFPISLVFGLVIGSAIGFVIWLSERLFHRNWSVLYRITISILCMVLLLVLFTILLYPALEESDAKFPWLYVLIYQISFAIPIGMMAGSRVRPWRVIARGIAEQPRLKVLFRRGPIRISNTIQELRFSFLAGLPLRLISLLGLMWFLLATACFLTFFLVNWRAGHLASVSHYTDDFIECLAVTFYFAATFLVSFTIRHKWTALGVAVFLHVPLAVSMINHPGLVPHYDVLRVLGIILVSLWLLFLIGLMILPVKKSKVQVEYGHAEIRFGKQQWVKESP